MPSRNPRINIVVDPQVYEQIKQLAEKTGCIDLDRRPPCPGSGSVRGWFGPALGSVMGPSSADPKAAWLRPPMYDRIP